MLRSPYVAVCLCSLLLLSGLAAPKKKSTTASERESGPSAAKKAEERRKRGATYLRGKIVTVLDDGILCRLEYADDRALQELEGEPCAVFGDFATVVDGEKWSGTVYPAGRYQYTEVNGTKKTVKAFALTLEAAFERQGLLGPIPPVGEIFPPFGLDWGESSTRLERLLAGAKAKIVKREKYGTQEEWQVEGLVQTGLRKTIFVFEAQELIRVMLVYSRTDWDVEKYNGFYAQVKQRISKRYGAPAWELKPLELPNARQSPTGEGMVREDLWALLATSIRLMGMSTKKSNTDIDTVMVAYSNDVRDLNSSVTFSPRLK